MGFLDKIAEDLGVGYVPNAPPDTVFSFLKEEGLGELNRRILGRSGLLPGVELPGDKYLINLVSADSTDRTLVYGYVLRDRVGLEVHREAGVRIFSANGGTASFLERYVAQGAASFGLDTRTTEILGILIQAACVKFGKIKLVEKD